MKKSQHRIHFENIFIRSLGGYCVNSPYKSIGDVIHWIYVFSENLHTSEVCTIGESEVHLHGKLMARIKWDDALQMPIFYDIDYHEHFEKNQAIFHEGLKKYKDFVREWRQRYSSLYLPKNSQNKRYGLKEKFYIAKNKEDGR